MGGWLRACSCAFDKMSGICVVVFKVDGICVVQCSEPLFHV
jgi:hypothetical protein